MQIQNLEINILFFLCDSRIERVAVGTAKLMDLLNELSDIPEGEIMSAISTMVDQDLITVDGSRSKLSITQSGIDRLRSSVACQIHHFDHCKCGQGTYGCNAPGKSSQ